MDNTKNKIGFYGRSAAELCKVRLEYRNRDLDIVSQKECALNDYA